MFPVILGLTLLIAGAIVCISNTSSKFGPAAVLVGAAILVLKVTGAMAADIPVPKLLTAEQRADRESAVKRRMPQKKFEDVLSSPIGRGRLE